MSDEAGQAQPRVLIVDDSRMVRASIAKQIRGSFDVREEADGEAGWQALLVDPTIEVVISDIGMPKLDGFGLLERIRASRVARVHELPVLVISGDEENEAREKARQLGANDFITKGIGSVELLARLQSLLTLASARRQLEESREALASHSPVDPVSGLVTPAYLQWHGNQEMSLARRRQAAISAMAIQIDGFEAIVERYGGHIAKLDYPQALQDSEYQGAQGGHGCAASGGAVRGVVAEHRHRRLRRIRTAPAPYHRQDGDDLS